MENTAAKITSILAEAATDAAFDETQLSENEKIDKAIKAVKGALDRAHTGAKAYLTAKPLHNILSKYSREDAILLIHKFVKKYEDFINATSPITGRTATYLQNPYADKSDDYIQSDIKFTILIVYFAEITEENMKTVVTEALKGIFGTIKKVVHKEYRNR